MYEYLNTKTPEKDELGHSWLPPHSWKRHTTYSTFAVVNAPTWAVKKSQEPQVLNANPFMKRHDLSDAVAMWNYEALKCATESIVKETVQDSPYMMVSLRNNNQIHSYLDASLNRLRRFSAKLTQMEEDDWIEKIEALATVFLFIFYST